MQRTKLCLLPILALSLIACEENKPEPAPVTKPSAAPAKTTAKPAPTPAPKKEDAKWADFPGPKVKADIGDAKKVWTVLPVSTGFDLLKFGYPSVVKAEEDVVVVDGFVPAHVPGVFVHKPVENKNLKKGAPVMVDEAASGPLGRVVEAGDKIKVKYMFMSVSDTTESPDAVWPLEGKVAFAESVAYKDGTKWSYGRVAHSEKDKTWIVTSSGHVKQVDTSALKPLDIKTIYKVGDTVWAVWVGGMEPAKITEVVDEGVAYKVKYDSQTEEKLLSFAEVTKPLE